LPCSLLSVSPDEYRERARLIEKKVNDELDAVRRSFWLWHPQHRSGRYSSGIGDVICEAAIAEDRERLDQQMHAEMEALNDEFYGVD